MNSHTAIDGKGVYVLLLSLPITSSVTIGRLGTFHFPAGFYLYVGSAMGPGGLAARLGRHIRLEKRLHWHIDYLRPIVALEEIWLQVTQESIECRWAHVARHMSNAMVPVPGFGASDCRCSGHLIHLPARPRAPDFALSAGIPISQIQLIAPDEDGG